MCRRYDTPTDTPSSTFYARSSRLRCEAYLQKLWKATGFCEGKIQRKSCRGAHLSKGNVSPCGGGNELYTRLIPAIQRVPLQARVANGADPEPRQVQVGHVDLLEDSTMGHPPTSVATERMGNQERHSTGFRLLCVSKWIESIESEVESHRK